MKERYYKVSNIHGLAGLGATVGDVVRSISSASNGLLLCEPVAVSGWTLPQIWFSLEQLEETTFQGACTGETFEDTISRVCSEPASPPNHFTIPEVPQEANEAFTAPSVPSTGTSHDAHYASMAVEPVTISEMIMENENIPPKARYHAAKAVEYFTRAGLKEGQDWKKEFEKALNHGYRAIHGKWPWEVRDH